MNEKESKTKIQIQQTSFIGNIFLNLHSVFRIIQAFGMIYALYAITSLQDRSLLVKSDNIRSLLIAGVLCLLSPVISVYQIYNYSSIQKSVQVLLWSSVDLILSALFASNYFIVNQSIGKFCKKSDYGIKSVDLLLNQVSFYFTQIGSRFGFKTINSGTVNSQACKMLQLVSNTQSIISILWLITGILILFKIVSK